MEGSHAQSGNTTKKWLIGCGIGCGAIVIIVAVLIAAGFFFVKNIVTEFKDTEAMMSTLTERYGRIEDFCPEPDGSIKPERLQAFLEARAEYAPIREKISRSLDALSKGKDSGEVEIKKPKNVVKMIRLGFGIIPQIAEFIKTRNQALLNVEMGMGEYYYLYVIVYYSWLGKQPEDGPDFQIVGPDYEEDRFRYWDREDIKEDRRERMLRRTSRMILPMMRCQLQKLEGQNTGPSLEQWRMALTAEIKAMEADNEHLPWQDGVPEVLDASLRPFKTRLEASYLPTTNPLEMVLEHR
ncbi:MAG: hypothetical protein JXB23_06710 [Candidatus Aminicenantes bacterium]|nr:hypothetical protein [Candidatus Aminicenantes bacterium]